jgi:hypothetical protein
LAIELGSTRKLAGIHLFTGYGSKDVIQSFKVEFWSGGEWKPIPSAEVKVSHGYGYLARHATFNP